MVRVRGGSAGAGCITRLRDEDIEIVKPSTTKSPRKGTKARGGKRTQPARVKRTNQTEAPPTEVPNISDEEQHTVEPSIEPFTRKSPRTRTDVPTAPQCSRKRKHPTRGQSAAQTEDEPTPIPKFIDDDARERFEWISQKGFITQRAISPHEFRKFDLEPILKLFEFQKWTHILTIPNIYYLDMLHQFFANFRKGSSHTDLVSRVNSVDIAFNPDIVNAILKTKIEDDFKEKIVKFFSYEEFPSAYHHFHVAKLLTYFQTHFNTPAEAKLEDLSPQNLIILSIISNLLVPTDDYRTDANKMELYLFYCFLEKIRIDFGFVICKFLLKINTDSRRKLFYGKFLIPIFAHFNIPFTGVSPKESASTIFSKAYFER